MRCRGSFPNRSTSRSRKRSFTIAKRPAAGWLSCVAWLSHTWRDERTDLVVCGHIHLLPAAWLLARLRGARLALIIHGVEAWAPSRRFVANWLARRVDAVIAVSRYSAEQFARWSKVPMERAFVLPNCVDLDTFQPQPRDPALLERYGLNRTKSF